MTGFAQYSVLKTLRYISSTSFGGSASLEYLVCKIKLFIFVKNDTRKREWRHGF